MLLDKKTYAEYNPNTMLFEVYDMMTGKLLRVERKKFSVGHVPENVETEEVLLSSGEVVLVEKGIDIVRLNMSLAKPRFYSERVVDLLCQRIAEGGSVTGLCQVHEDLPTYATLCRWKRLVPELEGRLEQARVDRAEYLRDRALAEAMAATDKNDTPAQNLKYEAHKWAAQMDDQKRYGTKNKVDVAVAATMLVVDTGITRERPVEEISHGENKISTESITSSNSSSSGITSSVGEY